MPQKELNTLNPTVALIVAAGSGSRTQLPKPKQYMTVISGTDSLQLAILAFACNSDIDFIKVVIGSKHEYLYKKSCKSGVLSGQFSIKHKALAKLLSRHYGIKLTGRHHDGLSRSQETSQPDKSRHFTLNIDEESLLNEAKYMVSKKLLPPVFGGVSRQQSVFSGLESIENLRPKYVLIHDAARPLISQCLLNQTIQNLQNGALAVDVAMPVVDTIKEYNSGKVLNRDKLYRTQTPQAFDYPIISTLHKKYQSESEFFTSLNHKINTTDSEIGNPSHINCPIHFTDDISMCVAENIPFVHIQGEDNNFKVTHHHDLLYLRFLIQNLIKDRN